MSSRHRLSSYKNVVVHDTKQLSIEEHFSDGLNYSIDELYTMHRGPVEDDVKLSYLAEMGGVQGVAFALRSNIKNGLMSDEVDRDVENPFAEREAKYGINKFTEPPITTYWEFVVAAFDDPVLNVLIVAGIVAFIIGMIEDAASGWYEGAAILMAVVIVVNVDAFNNVQQDKQFRSLDSSREEPICDVIRAGRKVEIPHSQVQVGDVLELEPNQRALIPADGLVIEGQIEVNMSAHTGETIPTKANFYNPFLTGGGEVTSGTCTMLVTAVGDTSAYGQIMQGIYEQEDEQTKLQEKLENVATLIGYIGFVVAVLLFITLMIFWLVEEGNGDDPDPHDILEYFIVAVTIIVVAVPEGLPLAVTISLAYSMGKMAEDQNLVRHLKACETMGNATAICSDKTGTLTLNQMRVTRSLIGRQRFNDTVDDALPEHLQEILTQCVLINSDIDVIGGPQREEYNDKPEKWTWTSKSNETEKALVSWLIRSEYCGPVDPTYVKTSLEGKRNAYTGEIAAMLPFDSKIKRSSVVINHGDGYRQFFKGAADVLLDGATHYLEGKDSKEHEMTEQAKEELSAELKEFNSSGLRSIGFAYADFDTLEKDGLGQFIIPEAKESTWVGHCGIRDGLRPGSRVSVRECQRAGVIVRMVTGDALDTAKYIAKDCGIYTSEDYHIAMTGPEFRTLYATNKDQLKSIMPRLRVLARSSPLDKQILVNWLKEENKQIVAVTGDGTNDAPALRAANVGLAMNIAGTPVAKKAADILILDDKFSSIVMSIKWGRSVYDNIRKFVQFQLTVNLVALTISLIGAFTQYINPLTAVQLLWVNLIMDTMAALALGTEIPTKALLKRKPYHPEASIVSHVMWRNIIGQTITQIVVLCIVLYAPEGLFDRVEEDGRKEVVHYTCVFNTFVFLQIFNEINSRKVMDEQNVCENFFANGIFTFIIVVTVLMQFCMVQFFGTFADTTGLDVDEWLITVALGAIALPVGVIVRLIPVNFHVGEVDPEPQAFEGSDLNNFAIDWHIDGNEHSTAAEAHDWHG